MSATYDYLVLTVVPRVFGSYENEESRYRWLSTPGFHTLSTTPLVSEMVYRCDTLQAGSPSPSKENLAWKVPTLPSNSQAFKGQSPLQSMNYWASSFPKYNLKSYVNHLGLASQVYRVLTIVPWCQPGLRSVDKNTVRKITVRAHTHSLSLDINVRYLIFQGWWCTIWLQPPRTSLAKAGYIIGCTRYSNPWLYGLKFWIKHLPHLEPAIELRSNTHFSWEELKPDTISSRRHRAPNAQIDIDAISGVDLVTSQCPAHGHNC